MQSFKAAKLLLVSIDSLTLSGSFLVAYEERSVPNDQSQFPGLGLRPRRPKRLTGKVNNNDVRAVPGSVLYAQSYDAM